MIDFIHVGDYKTGTSWLQKYFYPVCPDINYLGGPFDSFETEYLLHELIDSRDLNFDGEKIKYALSKLLIRKEKRKKTGMCREVFSCTDFITGENARRNAERIYTVFGPVKIIYVIREQLDMIRSIYSQYLKIGGTLPIENFIYDPIISKGFLERLKWHKQIQMYYDIFGQENVHIGLYEEFKYDKQSFLIKLCRFLEIMNFEITENEKVINKGLTTIGGAFARFGNGFFRSHYNNANKLSFYKTAIKLFITSNNLKEMQVDTEKRIIPNYGHTDIAYRTNYMLNLKGVSTVKNIAEKITIGNPLHLSVDQKQILQPLFIESNQMVIDEYNLSLQSYNYSL